MPTRLAPLRHDQVDACLDVFESMLGAAGHGANLDTVAVQRLHHVRWRGAHGAQDEPGLRVLDHHLEDLENALLRMPAPRRLVPQQLRLHFGRQRGNPGVIKNLLDEVDMLLRQRLETFRHRHDLAHLVGKEHVDAVRPAESLLIHIREDSLEFVGLVVARR
jgi:hypothetical protein